MTKREAARAYEKIADDLERLHLGAADYISRMDNNWQFEAMCSMRYVADRIRKGYNVIYTKGGGPHTDRATGKTSDHP